MPYTAFKSLKSDGSIPSSLLPCTSWVLQYNYELDASDGPNATGDSDFTVLTVGADIEIRDSAGSAICAFKWSTQTTLSGFDVFFSWYVSSQSIKFTTPDSVSTQPPLLHDGNDGTNIPGGGQDFNMQSVMETPIVNIPLPAGAKVHVSFHNAGYPYTAPLTDIQISTRLGGGGFPAGVRISGDTDSLILVPGTSALQQYRSVDRSGSLQSPVALDWGADGNVAILRQASQSVTGVVYDHAGNIRLRSSSNDGGQYGDAMTIYTGYSLLGAAQYKGGTLILMQNKAGKVYAGFGDRSGSWADPVAVTLPSGSSLAPGVLIGGGGQLDFYWADSSGGINHLFSRNDGITWA